MMIGATRMKLVGILLAGPTLNLEGEIELQRPNKITVASMMHLGQVLKSTRLLELENFVLPHLRNLGAPTQA